jgi:hypothetical protein
MITLNQMIYQIYEGLQISSDDTSLDKWLIKDLINQSRANWIRKEHNKNRSIDDNVIQDLGCIDIELTDRISANCCDISTDCRILRSKYKIPNAIELNHEKIISRVSAVDFMSIPIIFMDYDAAIYFGNGRYNKKALAAFIKSNYLYIIYNKGAYNMLIEKLNVQGVFEDPTEAAQFDNGCGEPCFTWDSRYPINAWMWQTLVKPEILNELRSKRTLYRDENNNGKDDAIPSVAANFTQAGTDPGQGKQQQQE